MGIRLRRRLAAFISILTIVAPGPRLSAGDADANSESKRWRYFLREAQFNRLLLDPARQYHQPKSFVIRGATV